MSNTQINLSNSNDWSFRGRQSKTAKKTIINGKEKYLAIPAFDLGYSLTARFLAVEILVKTAKSTWKSGGFLQRFYPLPFATQSNPKGKGLFKSYFLLVNSTNLIELPRLSGKAYRLFYSPPRWFKDVNIKIWLYQGEENNFIFDSIKRIETKVDQLL